MAWPYQTRTATIANGASLSDAVDIGGTLLGGLAMPAGWTAASMTFQASHDGVTFRNVYDDEGTEYAVSAAADRYIVIDPSKFAGAQQIKLRSGTGGAGVNQGAERTITLCCRDIT